MSVNLKRRVDRPGNADHLDSVWALKERIRETDGVLMQRRGFFTEAYRRSTTHLYVADDDVIGFVSARSDGYILFLAVAPEFRGDGHGRRLVAAVANDHDTVTCHARTTNRGALRFYKHLGFEPVRQIEGYYEDGGDAYYLRLGEGGLRERLSEFLG